MNVSQQVFEQVNLKAQIWTSGNKTMIINLFM